jgi:hypothetical protein
MSNSETQKLSLSWPAKLEVLKIELEDSYIKRPVGPMITVETCDIGKLTNIPSMTEGATVKDTTLQKILYLGLLNQCWKCHQFGHFSQTCTMTKIPIWSESTPVNAPPTWFERVAQGPIDTFAT